jgi:hypothetical protein
VYITPPYKIAITIADIVVHYAFLKIPVKPDDGFKPKRVAVFKFLHDIHVVSDGYLLVPSVFSKAV